MSSAALLSTFQRGHPYLSTAPGLYEYAADGYLVCCCASALPATRALTPTRWPVPIKSWITLQPDSTLHHPSTSTPHVGAAGRAASCDLQITISRSNGALSEDTEALVPGLRHIKRSDFHVPRSKGWIAAMDLGDGHLQERNCSVTCRSQVRSSLPHGEAGPFLACSLPDCIQSPREKAGICPDRRQIHGGIRVAGLRRTSELDHISILEAVTWSYMLSGSVLHPSSEACGAAARHEDFQLVIILSHCSLEY